MINVREVGMPGMSEAERLGSWEAWRLKKPSHESSFDG